LGSPGETTLNLDATGKTSKDGSRSGLQGVLRDLMLARAFLSKNSYQIFECMHGIRLFKTEVVGALGMFFQQEQRPKHFVIYFSGHGHRQTGNWIFTDGELSLFEVYDIFSQYAPVESCLSIVADSCHSGAWVELLMSCPTEFDMSRFAIQAACLKDEVCWDTSVGGMFTKSWVSGAYYHLSRRQAWEYRGSEGLADMQSAFKESTTSWLPWNGFLSNNPGLLALRLFAVSSFYSCSKECSNLISDPELEHSQHPIASHPYAFNLMFHDNRFAEMDPKERFPDEGISREYIDLQRFWLGRS
jgi:hypothetical protein